VAKSRAKTGRSAGGRKTAAKRKTASRRQPREVRLKPVFESMNHSLEQLRGAKRTGEVKDAIARLTTCLRELKGICGADMILPITSTE
jgi:hypothetical protein